MEITEDILCYDIVVTEDNKQVRLPACGLFDLEGNVLEAIKRLDEYQEGKK